MRLRNCGGALWGAALGVPLYGAVLAGCANAELATAGNEDPQSPDSCEYRNVFVELDNPSQVTDPRVEPLRRAILTRAAEVFPELSLITVADPSEAYWRLFANAWTDRQGNPLVHLGMRGELKLGRHLFVVAMADESWGSSGSRRELIAGLAPGTRAAYQMATVLMLTSGRPTAAARNSGSGLLLGPSSARRVSASTALSGTTGSATSVQVPAMASNSCG